MEIMNEPQASRSDRIAFARTLLMEAIEILVEEGLLVAAAKAQHAHDSCDSIN